MVCTREHGAPTSGCVNGTPVTSQNRGAAAPDKLAPQPGTASADYVPDTRGNETVNGRYLVHLASADRRAHVADDVPVAAANETLAPRNTDGMVAPGSDARFCARNGVVHARADEGLAARDRIAHSSSDDIAESRRNGVLAASNNGIARGCPNTNEIEIPCDNQVVAER